MKNNTTPINDDDDCNCNCICCCKSSSSSSSSLPPPLHVLVVTYPTQGHINPLLQFSKRLVSKGLKVTLAITVFIAKSMSMSMQQLPNDSIRIKTFSDGFDQQGSAQADTIEAYFERFKIVGSQTLRDLITKQQQQQLICSCCAFCCVVYDPFLPWALDVAKEFTLLAVPFFTQSCAVNNIYFHVQQGLLSLPLTTTTTTTTTTSVSVPGSGLPPMEISDFPSFISKYGSYPSIRYLVLNQFSNINNADWIFVNSFHMLEHQVLSCLSKIWPIRTIGPTLPSFYLDNRLEGDNDYGLHLFHPSTDTCIHWLNTKQIRSVVYVSFGSLAALTPEQMDQLASALIACNHPFLWVVRASEFNKLPTNFSQQLQSTDKGLMVTWCPQLQVLSHPALGCFVSHCGWNSTLEALSLGVPMVALPQWTDQPTNAKYVEDVFKMGLRTRVNDNGISTKTEIETCIRQVMQGEKGEEIKRNANTWKTLAKEAVDKGGSSDNNIEEFVSNLHLCSAEKVDASHNTQSYIPSIP